MPLWAIMVMVLCSSAIALITIINFFRAATRECIEHLESKINEQTKHLEEQIEQVNKRIEMTNERIDKHLENHP